MTDVHKIRAGIRELHNRLERHLAGEYQLTEEEMRLASDLSLWYQGYQSGLAAAKSS